MYAKVLRILQLKKSILLYDNLKSEKKIYIYWKKVCNLADNEAR